MLEAGASTEDVALVEPDCLVEDDLHGSWPFVGSVLAARHRKKTPLTRETLQLDPLDLPYDYLYR